LVCDWFSGRDPGLRSSRLLSATFGALAIVMALIAPFLGEHVFDIIIRVSGAVFGPLLGLFVLGAASARANAPGALIGLAAGGLSLALIFPSEIGVWWYGAFTCVPTLVVGWLSSLFFPAPPLEKVRLLLLGRHQGAREIKDMAPDPPLVAR